MWAYLWDRAKLEVEWMISWVLKDEEPGVRRGHAVSFDIAVAANSHRQQRVDIERIFLIFQLGAFTLGKSG